MEGWRSKFYGQIPDISLKLLAVWIVRVAVGTVFVFSGFSKAVDPWGSFYKVQAYLAELHWILPITITLAGVFLLCMSEFLIGVMLVLGCFRRSSVWIATLVMAFMLPLSLWIALADPVEDCGCFGDALIISNWATFCKNIVLTGGCIWLLNVNKVAHWLITPALQWIALLVSALFIGAIETIGYVGQPLVDFRQYKVGEALVDGFADNSGTPHFQFIYEKEGVRKTFSETEELPDENDGWTFVDREEIHSMAGVKDSSSENKTLRIWTGDGEEDLTEDVLVDTPQLIVFIPSFKSVSLSAAWKLNAIYDWTRENGVSMIAVGSGSQKDIEDWKDLSMADFPVYTADDTQIKEVVRGNPGLVYMDNGKIVWKRNLSAIEADDFARKGVITDLKELGFDNTRTLHNLFWLYAGIIIVLSFLSFSQNLFRTRKLPCQ